MKVSIIGQGYVGLTISAFAAEFYEVVGFDNMVSLTLRVLKVQSLRAGSRREGIVLQQTLLISMAQILW
jgi:UDP-glucose 6-dehydrogenase